MKEAGGGAGKPEQGLVSPAPHPQGLHALLRLSQWDPSAPYITGPGLRPPPPTPGSPPETIAGALLTRPYVPAPPPPSPRAPAACPLRPVGASSRPGMNCVEAARPTNVHSGALGYPALKLLEVLVSLEQLPLLFGGSNCPLTQHFEGIREPKNEDTMCFKFFRLAFFF